MRILRSQYMKLRNRTAVDNNDVMNGKKGGGSKKLDDTSGPKNNNTNKKISVNHVRQTIDCSSNQNDSTSMNISNTDCRETVNCSNQNGSAPSVPFSMYTNIHIYIRHVDQPIKKLHVIVEFINMDALWLTKLFKKYENDLWRRTKRFHGNKSKDTRWYYHCCLCKNIYRQFSTLKGHLNLHLNYFPYICKVCGEKYTNRKSATKHLRNNHEVEKEQWDDYLTLTILHLQDEFTIQI